MALESQSGLRITVSTTRVTQPCPARIDEGGCSLFPPFGTTHETAGSVPARAERKKSRTGRTSRTCWSRWTVANSGRGFQMSGVVACCGFGVQNIASSSQSGCVPGVT